MRCEQPDAQFAVELLLRDAGGTMIESRRVVDLPDEMQDTLRTYRVSFHVTGNQEPGTCAIAFGLPYTKVLRGGRFWVGDVELRTGREVETLEAHVRPWTVSAGESIDLCISAGRGQADVDVFLEAASPTPMMPTLHLTGLSAQPAPDAAMAWPATTTSTTIRICSTAMPG